MSKLPKRATLSSEEKQIKYNTRLVKQKEYQKQLLSTPEGKKRVYENYKRYYDLKKARNKLRQSMSFIDIFISLLDT